MRGMSFNLSQKRYGTCFQLNKMGKQEEGKITTNSNSFLFLSETSCNYLNINNPLVSSYCLESKLNFPLELVILMFKANLSCMSISQQTEYKRFFHVSFSSVEDINYLLGNDFF